MSWPYYEKQGYKLFHHIVGNVEYPAANGWKNGDMVIMSFFKRLYHEQSSSTRAVQTPADSGALR